MVNLFTGTHSVQTYSDLQGIRTTAKQDGSDWILNGSKTFITNGFLSDLVIVVAITDTKAKSTAHGISLFLVEAGTPGFTKGRKLEKMGFKAQVSRWQDLKCSGSREPDVQGHA